MLPKKLLMKDLFIKAEIKNNPILPILPPGRYSVSIVAFAVTSRSCPSIHRSILLVSVLHKTWPHRLEKCTFLSTSRRGAEEGGVASQQKVLLWCAPSDIRAAQKGLRALDEQNANRWHGRGHDWLKICSRKQPDTIGFVFRSPSKSTRAAVQRRTSFRKVLYALVCQIVE